MYWHNESYTRLELKIQKRHKKCVYMFLCIICVAYIFAICLSLVLMSSRKIAKISILLMTVKMIDTCSEKLRMVS